jgi:type II secretory pathway pseudopilin PulG
MKAPHSKHGALGQPPQAQSAHKAQDRAKDKAQDKAQGMALIEALVASLVLAVGLTAATRLTLHTLTTASDTRQRTVALALALDAMDCHQSGRAGCPLQSATAVQGTTYILQSQVQMRPGLALVDLQVRVQWPAVGPALGAAGIGSGGGSGAGPTGQAQPHMGELVLHSSRDAVPSWHGVSSP